MIVQRSGEITVMAMDASYYSEPMLEPRRVSVTIRASSTADAWAMNQPCPLAARIKKNWFLVEKHGPDAFSFWTCDPTNNNKRLSLYLIEGAAALRIREAFFREGET